jgi:hypothetical protein
MSIISHSTDSFKDITSSGWLVTVLNFASDLDYFAPLKERMNVKMKKVIYSVVNKLQTLMCQVLLAVAIPAILMNDWYRILWLLTCSVWIDFLISHR